MPTLLEGLGTEEITDLVDVVMRDTINDAIAYQEERMQEHDAMRAAALGVPHVPLTVERIPPGNFHVGAIPSFVQTEDRVEAYPMLVTRNGRTTPDAEHARMDGYGVYQNALMIDTFARCDPDEAEGPQRAEIAWRRAMRMAEAVHHVICTDPRVARKVAGVAGPILVERSEPWYFMAVDGHGEDWVWVAVMHMYQIKNYSMTPQEV